jgi:hypothetical protein
MKLLWFGLSILLLTGCGPTRGILKDSILQQPIQISGKVSKVSFVDYRSDVQSRALKIPFMSFPGDYDKLSPALTDRDKAIVEAEVRRAFFQGNDVEVEITFERGYQLFEATFWAEKETVEVSLKIKFKRSNRVAMCTGFAKGYKSSMDASEAQISILWSEALEVSTYKCLEGLMNSGQF